MCGSRRGAPIHSPGGGGGSAKCARAGICQIPSPPECIVHTANHEEPEGSVLKPYRVSYGGQKRNLKYLSRQERTIKRGVDVSDLKL